jgi:hypothetical protein
VAQRGSHRQSKHPSKPVRITIAGKPSDELAKDTQMSILKQAGLRGLEQSSSTQLSLRGLESIAEFESNFHAAIEDYLAASQVLCSSPEKPASGKLMLRISPEKHAAAIKAAA